jgi:hypothetical protein
MPHMSPMTSEFKNSLFTRRGDFETKYVLLDDKPSDPSCMPIDDISKLEASMPLPSGPRPRLNNILDNIVTRREIPLAPKEPERSLKNSEFALFNTLCSTSLSFSV